MIEGGVPSGTVTRRSQVAISPMVTLVPVVEASLVATSVLVIVGLALFSVAVDDAVWSLTPPAPVRSPSLVL